MIFINPYIADEVYKGFTFDTISTICGIYSSAIYYDFEKQKRKRSHSTLGETISYYSVIDLERNF